MKQAFVARTFSEDSYRKIVLINTIIEEYRRQGFRLSLRQLYYQLVARGYIENSQRSYKNVGNLVSNARQAGLIDWDMIEDRNRETVIPQHWDNPGEIVRAAANSYHIDKWADQPIHVEVMVEKDALSGVLLPVCRRLDVGVTANKGYSSSSAMYEIGRRLQHKALNNSRTGRPVRDIEILYLGDHDPSGIDMTRDVDERLLMYSELSGNALNVNRVALNMDQVEQWNPPENPAKETDARFAGYVSQYGDKSWELDAIEPVTLAELVENFVIQRRDDDLWNAMVEREDEERQRLLDMAEAFEDEEGGDL